MFERRPIFGLLIGLMICISIWRISMQEPAMLADEMNIYTTNQFQQLQQQQSHIYTPSLESTVDNNNQITDQTYYLQKSIKKLEKVVPLTGNNPKYVTDNSRSSIKISPSILNTFNSTKLITNSLTRINNQISILTLSSITDNDEQIQDIKKLIDFNNFEYLINQRPCPKLTNEYDEMGRKILSSEKLRELTAPLILILVHSAPPNYQKRLLIRETWGSFNSSKLRLIFLLGAVFPNLQQSQIELENNMFGDIVQGNFIDNYRNMTYKHVMALKWFTYYCPNAKYLLKTDDDVFVNTPQLIEFFKEENLSNRIINNKRMPNNQQYNRNILPNHNLIFCQKQNWSRVKRSYRSKWRVSTKEYSGRYYPPYCPGYAIIYSSDVAFKLYKLAQNNKYFWIDDVHITGTIAQLANISITTFKPFLLTKLNYESNKNLIELTDLISVPINNNSRGTEGDSMNKNINYIFLFSWPDINEKQISLLWKFVQKNEKKAIR